MTITSTAFQQNDPIPKEHGREGGNISPPLTFSEVPPEAKSMALIVEDPDAPEGTFAHWIVYNMSPATLQMMPGVLPKGAKVATNDAGEQGYFGPAPPPGKPHRYFFKLYALDNMLALEPGDTDDDFYDALEGKVIAQAEIVGMFQS
jgi:Raf kinase inhibitor-like YbhB/YbcL family protein